MDFLRLSLLLIWESRAENPSETVHPQCQTAVTFGFPCLAPTSELLPHGQHLFVNAMYQLSILILRDLMFYR